MSELTELRGPKDWLRDLLWTLPFLVLFWVNLAHHEMWLDELNAWGIAAASPTLRTLFANVHYEGHPWLWYFILWVPSRFTHAPVAMKWVEAGIGTAIYLVVGFLSPFTRWQKVLLFLNYFVAFEYTVISRTYGVMLLFALLYTWRRSARPRAYLGNMVLLGALANTDMTGIVLSGALLLEYMVRAWPGIARKRAALIGLAMYFAMLGFSVHSLLPAPDISWSTTGRMFSKAGNLPHLVHAVGDVVVGPWLPFAHGYPREFWNVDVYFNKYALGLIPVVLAAYWWVFRKRRSLLVLAGATIVFAVSFAHLVYLGFVRHWGISVVAFVLALWILVADGEGRRRWSRVATVLMVVSAVKGAAAMTAAWLHPFSETAIVAEWLRAQRLDKGPIAGAGDYSLAGVAEQLQRPVYFLDCSCVDTYVKFAHRRDGLTAEQFPARIRVAYDALHAETLTLVMGEVLRPQELAALRILGLGAVPLQHFSGSEDLMEFYVYRVESVVRSQ